MQDVEFANGSVPIAVVAKIFGKDAYWVRTGIIKGWLPIGIATRNGIALGKDDECDSRKGRINYYISAQKLYELTGYIWKGKD